MGCVPLPGTTGVQQLERDVYRDQRDSGEFITNANAYLLLHYLPYCHRFFIEPQNPISPRGSKEY